MVFAVNGLTGVIILLAIIGVTAVIALVSYIVYRYTHPKLKDEGKPTEEEILNEEMERILKPIDDEDVAKQVNEYKDKDE